MIKDALTCETVKLAFPSVSPVQFF